MCTRKKSHRFPPRYTVNLIESNHVSLLPSQIVGVAPGDAGTYTAFADNGLGPPATAAVSLSVDPASDTNVPASVIELEPGKKEMRELPPASMVSRKAF